MVSIITAGLRQNAVLFAEGTTFDDYGQLNVNRPGIDIKVRWEARRGDTVDSNSNTVAYDAVVAVDRVINPGSIMWLGRISDLTGTGTSQIPTDNIYQVITYEEVPDIRGSNPYREVKLMRFGDTMPTAV